MDMHTFYFITDQYFIDFPDTKLMSNKETISGKAHNRPCYYAFQDHVSGLYWLIPISSQIGKFQSVYDSKAAKYGICDTIHFGYVLGAKKAFLLQNMCPITERYINNQYMDAATGLPVTVHKRLAQELDQKARKVLKLYRQGKPLIFPDAATIEAQLLGKSKLQTFPNLPQEDD